MISRLGGHEGPMISFISAALNLRIEDIEPVVAATHGPEVRDARSRVADLLREAEHFPTVDSEARVLVKELRRKFPASATARERAAMVGFTSLLGSAVFALPSRTRLDDDTVALVVDLFAQRLGFEWRSSGAHSGIVNLWNPDAGLFEDDEAPEPEVDFQDIYDSVEHRFSIGAEIMHGTDYLSFPVSNGLVDYEENYALTADEWERLRADSVLALPLVEQCRRRKQDHRLLQQPDNSRGMPV